MEGGYNFEAIGKVMPEMKCPICLLLLCEATEISCSHVTCKVCLQNLEEKQNFGYYSLFLYFFFHNTFDTEKKFYNYYEKD